MYEAIERERENRRRNPAKAPARVHELGNLAQRSFL